MPFDLHQRRSADRGGVTEETGPGLGESFGNKRSRKAPSVKVDRRQVFGDISWRRGERFGWAASVHGFEGEGGGSDYILI